MTEDNTSNSGVVDPSILDTDLEVGIPTFLQRDEPDGQIALTVENLPSVSESDVAKHIDNVQEDARVEQALADAGVTPQGNEALVSNAPSEIEKAGEGVHSLELQHDTTEGNGSEETQAPSVGHNQPADPAEMRRDFFKDINRFGKQSGEGASALGRLALRALRAAADGVISTAKPQGGGKDDATLIYEAYQAMDSKHAEHTAGGSKANASKLRQIIGMGCMTTLADPVAVGDRMVRIHERMTDAELKPKALFAALVDTARAQAASDTELTDAAIEECLTKTKADKTLEKEWEAINKRVEGLITGEASHGLKDDSEAALKIGELIAERLKNFKDNGSRLDRIEMLIENGYTAAQAEAIVDKKIDVA